MVYYKRSNGTKSLKTKTRGTVTTRKVGYKNFTDAGYKKVKGKTPTWRKPGIRNTTDSSNRVSYKTGGMRI